jgi:hypothetical protein
MNHGNPFQPWKAVDRTTRSGFGLGILLSYSSRGTGNIMAMETRVVDASRAVKEKFQRLS